MSQIDDLSTIQRMQFYDLAQAESLLQRWFERHMKLSVEQVKLTPKAVSLNSFNGIYTLNGEEFFFKTHVEEQGIVKEYYHAELLSKAGYNIVKPLRTLHEEGQQMVIYPVIRWPVMFDLMRAVETGSDTPFPAEALVAAEQLECERLLGIYQRTLEQSSAEEHAQAPVHQLFWHRLTGERLKTFYSGKTVPLPISADQRGAASSLPFEELLDYRWIINGHPMRGAGETLRTLIERAAHLLNPAREALTVIGHGDAHFGNVFLEQQREYCYFDPAFAGRHSPLLDIVKPFFHNVYASWMYFPREIAQALDMRVQVREGEIVLEHNYRLAPVRRAMLETKRERLLAPLIQLLLARQGLPEDWREIMQSALLCCPLLTVNLLDEKRMPASVCWLGLSQVMEMGNFAFTGD